ncbi:ArsC family reductase [Parazoarcus communis]|uniref:ArsC family reductase n=1 Tax=Parazoarcus communis SWub3 = DSM 12120 TaxID=1121029 RepID=A0A323UUB3_9RHOO|nr:ArsC family reductase [Parazoarcus communis]NMG70310.1 ArsC family reductase [Parazoarcus communis SWub3 = DSM 12120]PZA16085.1 ArsC family reductase [Azoarcus communis] [Parazoarcus communis SWub3 = DSM 12120]
METVIYGIKNCDTMKKTFAWMAEHGAAYRFHDYRKDGLTSGKLHDWSKALGWKTLINTRGTTWRKLSPEEQAIDTQSAAVQLMLANPSLIKRPVIETASGHLLVGFDPALLSSFIKPAQGEA